jgi:hypothetical protein
VAGNQKTNEMERQARQMNGYVLRSFLATGGPVVLPTKHGEGLMATPQNMGQTQYTQYNGVMGNYVSSFTEPLNAPMDSGMIALSKLGIQARSESASNPFKFLQFQLNMHNTQEQIKALEEKHKQLRGYNQEGSIQKAYQADLKARRGGKKQSKAVAAHQAMTTPSTVRSAVQGMAPSNPMSRAILDTLSEDVLLPMSADSLPQAGEEADDGRLDPYDFDDRTVSEMESGTDRNMAQYDSYTPRNDRESREGGYVDEKRKDELEEEFPGVARSYIDVVYDTLKDDPQAIRTHLAMHQRQSMYSIAESQNIAVSTNAVTESLGLERSDQPFQYKNTIDPAFETHVESVVQYKKNLFQNSTVNNTKDLRQFDSGPAPASYSNSLLMMTPASRGSSSLAPTYHVSDAPSLANDMNRARSFTSLSPGVNLNPDMEMEEFGRIRREIKAITPSSKSKKESKSYKDKLRTKEQRRPSSKLKDL